MKTLKELTTAELMELSNDIAEAMPGDSQRPRKYPHCAELQPLWDAFADIEQLIMDELGER